MVVLNELTKDTIKNVLYTVSSVPVAATVTNEKKVAISWQEKKREAKVASITVFILMRLISVLEKNHRERVSLKFAKTDRGRFLIVVYFEPGGVLNKVLYGEVAPRGPILKLPYYIPCLAEKAPLSYPGLLCACSHHPPHALLTCSQLSLCLVSSTGNMSPCSQ